MKRKKDPNIYPPGYDAKRVRAIIEYYDSLQDVDLMEHPEHTPLPEPTAWIEVPVELVPKVQRLVAQHHKKSA